MSLCDGSLLVSPIPNPILARKTYLKKKILTKILVSLGKAVLSKLDQKTNRITFEARNNQPYFPVGLFGDFGEYSFNQSGSPSHDTPFPGIPLDPLVLENREKARAISLEVEFSTPAGGFLYTRDISPVSS